MTDLERIKHMLDLVTEEDIWKSEPYIHGLANGLILAISVLENKEVEFLKIDGGYKSV
jgi:hypothetical protein